MRTVQDLDGGTFEVPANPPLPATACRICRAVVTDRTICRACLYGPPGDTPEETELYETVLKPITTKENDENGTT